MAGSLTLLGTASILPASANSVAQAQSPDRNFEVRPNESITRPDAMGADRDELDMNDSPSNTMQPMQSESNTIQRLGNDYSGSGMYNQMYDTFPGSAAYDGLFPPDAMGVDRDELDANDVRVELQNYRDTNSNAQRNIIQRQGTVNQGSMYDRGNMVRPNNNMNNMNNMGRPNVPQVDPMGGERDELDPNDGTNMNNMNNSRPSGDVIRREGSVDQGGNVFNLNNLSQPENINRQDSMGADRDELDMNDMNNSDQPSSSGQTR